LLVTVEGYTQNVNIDSIVSAKVEKMTIDEKISMIGGYKGIYLRGFEKFGIPEIKMSDGPMGIKNNGKATAFPASIAMAATWNPELIQQVGKVIGDEAKSKKIGILLAPGVNIYRVPHNGRNFEYYGEDPYLSSSTVVSFVKGVQGEGVIATVKHFAANNEDYDRHRVSSNIDTRTLYEIYFPPFKAAIQEGGALAVMTSYNPVNGVHAPESSYLINDVLKKEWGFKGFVMSDWISLYTTNAVNAGLDLEMPNPDFMNSKNIIPLINNGVVTESTINDKVFRIIKSCYSTGLYNNATHDTIVDWGKHDQISIDVAREGMVLLKNDNSILPIQSKKIKKVALIGLYVFNTPHSGGGAARVEPYKKVDLFNAILNEAGKKVKIETLLTDSLKIDTFIKNESPDLNEKIASYDLVIICTGFNERSEGEGHDRPFQLPAEENKLIEKVSGINGNTAVIVLSGSGIEMPWINKVKALLYAWFPGQAGSVAAAEILFGKVNPSGKLPISIEKLWKNNAAYETYDTSHAILNAKPLFSLYGEEHMVFNMPYKEGIFTGYRHYDRYQIQPQFEFGFGLSYSNFTISDMKLSKELIKGDDRLIVSVKVKNSSDRKGKETVQLYIHDIESSLIRPVKELKAFKKVELNAGEEKVVELEISKKELSFYNPDLKKWVCEDGKFEALIGNSSRNITCRKEFNYQN